jgi:hypothetical protein
MSSQELLQQLAQALTQVLGGGNSGDLGFCEIPKGNDQVRFIFPGYTRQAPPYMHFLGEKDHRTGISPQIPVPGNALKGKLKFLNLIDVVSNGEDKQKLCFWIDCGSITYVLWLGWADQNGKLNNATESFLKALASLTPDELLEPFTFTLSRLIDKPSYDPSKGNPATAGKVLLTDVWKNDGTQVFSEQGHMDANAAVGVIVRINQHLTGQAVLTPRQPKAKTVIQEPQQQWGQQPAQQSIPQQYQQPQQQWGQQPAQQPTPQNYQQQYQQTQNLPQTTPQPTQQPQVQTPPVVGGLTQEQMQQFLAFQQQQSQNLVQAQQSLTPPPQWSSPVPTPQPAPTPTLLFADGSKVNW